MVNKQPLIRGHIWLIALGLVIAFAIYISAGGDLLAGAGGVTRVCRSQGQF
jgi:hypothetical protein